MKKIIYVTYQTFPANTANSLQTISNINYLRKNYCDVDLYFPLREKSSSNDFDKITEYYSIETHFNIFGLKHNYPHGRVKIFKRFFYHISHYLWSKKTVKNYFKNNSQDFFFTRSDWIAYILAKQGSNVTFEIHQTSKLRNLILRKISNLNNVKIIFLHENLKNYYKEIIKNNFIVLHNGVDSSLFNGSNSKQRNKLVFLGKLTRFNKTRGIEKIIESFQNNFVRDNYSLDIIGCSKREQEKILFLLKKYDLQNEIKTYGWLSREDAINKIESAEYGLLLNTSENKHSYLYTSPLKYFEYLYAGLKVLAVDFPSHRELPLSEKVSFYNPDDIQSFIKALKDSQKSTPLTSEELSLITLNSRAKKIISFIF